MFKGAFDSLICIFKSAHYKNVNPIKYSELLYKMGAKMTLAKIPKIEYWQTGVLPIRIWFVRNKSTVALDKPVNRW